MSKNKKTKFSEKYNIKWVFAITFLTFLLAVFFSIIAENSINNLGILSSFIILLLIIIIGIIFDIIGIAVTRAEEKPFHSMAAKKINEATIAIKLVRNAGQVSNFCNDVVGDISGIISGAVGATLVYKLSATYDLGQFTILSILITSLTAAITVGGKAFGKSIALTHYDIIVFRLAKFLNIFEQHLNIKFFKKKKNKKKR